MGLGTGTDSNGGCFGAVTVVRRVVLLDGFPSTVLSLSLLVIA